MRVKTRNFAPFRACDLPRTRAHSRPGARIRYLPLFQIGQFGLSEARAVLAHESSRDVSVLVSCQADFLSTLAAADKVAINYKCICFADYPSLLSDSWLFHQLVLLLAQLLLRLLSHLSDHLIDLHAHRLLLLVVLRLTG